MTRGKAKGAAGGPVEGPWPLPGEWRWERLGDVAPVNPRRPLDTLDDEDEIAFVPMAAVEAETGRIDVSSRRKARDVRQGFTRFFPGDVIFAKITPCMENGKIAIVPDIPHRIGCGSTEFHVMFPDDVLPSYLYHWVSRRFFRETAEFNMTGTAGQKRVPPDFIRNAVIPVPPRPIQERIVARIDALFAEIDDGEAALARARADLATWRKSLLKAAVTGALTADWRAANPPAETGAALLARILADRRTRWLADPRNKGKRYTEPPRHVAEDLPDLPQGWTWASLAQAAFISGGLTVDAKRKPVDPIDLPYLRVANVQRGHLDLRAVKTVTVDRSAVDGLLLRDGDILLNEGGDRDKIGRGWVYEGQIPVCLHQNHVFKARPANDAISPFLVSMYLNELGRRFFIDKGKQTTNLASISLSKISTAPVPIIPRNEAAEILNVYNGYSLPETDSGMDEVGSASTTLRQSVLAAAFRGALLP